MKSLITYFSGTGNTYFIAQKIRNEVAKYSEVDFIRIEKLDTRNLESYSALFIGFPVYEFDAPILVKEILVDFPHTENKKLYLFCTHGGFPGNALSKINNIIKNKGYILIDCMAIGLMDSGALTMMSKKSLIAKIVMNRNYNNLKKVNRFNQKLSLSLKNKNSNKSYHFKSSILEFIFGSLTKKYYKRFFSIIIKEITVNENCNKCQKCIKMCPVENIYEEKELIVFGNKCFACMRCINLCPQEAIQIGERTKNKMRWHGPYNCYLEEIDDST